jgi:hypothetical protein
MHCRAVWSTGDWRNTVTSLLPPNLTSAVSAAASDAPVRRCFALHVVYVSLALAAAIALAGWAGVLPVSGTGTTLAEAFPMLGARGRWKQVRSVWRMLLRLIDAVQRCAALAHRTAASQTQAAIEGGIPPDEFGFCSASGEFPPQLEAAEARRDRRLPYLFDAAAQPTAEEACG